MTKLNELTITEARKGLKNKDFSSVDLVTACLDRVNEIDPKILQYFSLFERQAQTQLNQSKTTTN